MKNNRAKKVLIGLATGSLAMGMLLAPKVNAKQNDINNLIRNKALNVENKTPAIEEKAKKEINELRYYAKEKKDAYIKKLAGKTEQEINALVSEAKTEYLKEISEKAKSESKILEGFLAEVKKYPEYDKNNPDYKIQSQLWEEKVAQDNLDNYKGLIKGKVDISKIKDLENYYDQFKFYIVHSQIEIMTRKVAIYRKNYPNNAEIERIFKKNIMQTKANYGTLDGIKLEEYFNNEFKPFFLEIQENVKLEDLKVDLAKLIQDAKAKKNTEAYNKKDAGRKNKFEAAIDKAEKLLAKNPLTIKDIKDIEKEVTALSNAMKEVDRVVDTPKPMPQPQPMPNPQPDKNEMEQDAAPLVPSFEKEIEQDAAPLVPSFEKEMEQDVKPLVPSHEKEKNPSKNKKANDKMHRNPKTSDPGIFLSANGLLISLGALAFSKKRKNK